MTACHATHLAEYDPACLVCTNLARWDHPPNPDPLRPLETDEPWADEDDDDVRVVWIGAVLLLVALLVGIGVGVLIGRTL